MVKNHAAQIRTAPMMPPTMAAARWLEMLSRVDGFIGSLPLFRLYLGSLFMTAYSIVWPVKYLPTFFAGSHFSIEAWFDPGVFIAPNIVNKNYGCPLKTIGSIYSPRKQRSP